MHDSIVASHRCRHQRRTTTATSALPKYIIQTNNQPIQSPIKFHQMNESNIQESVKLLSVPPHISCFSHLSARLLSHRSSISPTELFLPTLSTTFAYLMEHHFAIGDFIASSTKKIAHQVRNQPNGCSFTETVKCLQKFIPYIHECSLKIAAL